MSPTHKAIKLVLTFPQSASLFHCFKTGHNSAQAPFPELSSLLQNKSEPIFFTCNSVQRVSVKTENPILIPHPTLLRGRTDV